MKALRLTSLLALALLVLIAAACAPRPASTETPLAEPSATAASAAPTATSESASPSSGDTSLAAAQNDWFSTAATCDSCHQDIHDRTGRDVSQAENWRATMMANAARDPYYLASVSLELVEAPEYADAIQDKCSVCHMPLAHFSDAHEGNLSVMFGENGYSSPSHPLHDLAMDGVSCTACHQIPPNLPQAEPKNSGDLAIDFSIPRGARTLYGPYPVDEVGAMIMRGGSGYSITQSQHIRESALCATCHELYIHYIDEDGSISENYFPEQTPYAEWLHSDYPRQASCQSCHMDRAKGKVALSNLTPEKTHPHFAIHNFHGSNVYMLSILQQFGDELGVQSTDEQFETLKTRTLQSLQEESANLDVSPPRVDGESLLFQVRIETLTGHKFPTSFPSRRAWLHVTVRDAEGNLLFESGAAAPDGRIEGNANDDDPSAYEPHYDLITNPEQVQIYESIMQTPDGKVTTQQMRASGYIKDNRLLPAGFDKSSADPYIAVIGAAAEDENFLGGGDTVSYQIPVGGASGPFTVEVELLYQAVSYRWAQNVMAYDTPAAQDFTRYYDAVENLPVQVDFQRAVEP